VSGVPSEWEILALAGLLMAVFTALVATVAVYFIWVRRLSNRMLEMQLHLFKLASFLQKNVAPTVSAGETSTSTASAASPKGKRIAMSLEGRPVEIIEVEGRETVRFPEELSEAERARLLAYLKSEGFIS